ncbi:MAG: leucine-rich repeat domain-containing protein [Holosporales bacterium]|jgi:hypothetical protein|nr:leucine-rich repeat domain-containing protein [Holosporales bacterium]
MSIHLSKFLFNRATSGRIWAQFALGSVLSIGAASFAESSTSLGKDKPLFEKCSEANEFMDFINTHGPVDAPKLTQFVQIAHALIVFGADDLNDVDYQDVEVLFLVGNDFPSFDYSVFSNLKSFFSFDNVVGLNDDQLAQVSALVKSGAPLEHIKITNCGNCNIKAGEFAGAKRLKTVDLGNVSIIEAMAFSGCNHLYDVDLEGATAIGDKAFSDCTHLLSVAFLQATSIGNKVFKNCSKLFSVDARRAISIGNKAFAKCIGLFHTNFTNTRNIGKEAFRDCHSLIQISLPNAESIGGRAFAHCSRLQEITYPDTAILEGSLVFVGCPGPLTRYQYEGQKYEHLNHY